MRRWRPARTAQSIPRPPALPTSSAPVEQIERRDETEGGRIEDVRRLHPREVFRDDSGDRRDRGDVPRFLRTENHADDRRGEKRATREFPRTIAVAEDQRVENHRHGDSGGQAGKTGRRMSRRDSDGQDDREDDRQQSLRRAKETLHILPWRNAADRRSRVRRGRRDDRAVRCPGPRRG